MRHLIVALGVVVLIAGLYLLYQVRTHPVAIPGASSTDVSTVSAESDGVEEGRAEGSARHRAPPATAQSRSTGSAPQSPLEISDEDQRGDRADPSIDALMDRANKAYDRADFEEAKAIASDVLAKLPTSVRMMRIMVSASCIEGDAVVAQKWFDKLPEVDRAQMKIRCDRYGLSFRDPL